MKLSVYIIIFLGIGLLGTGWKLQREHNKRIIAEANVSRLQENQEAQAKEDSAKYTHLVVKVNELPEVINHVVDSVMKANNIKGKNTERVIERNYYYFNKDSSNVKPKPVESPIGKIFPFDKWFDCMHLVGYMQVDSLQPSLTLTGKEYRDQITDIIHIKRTKSFLGIKYGPFKGQILSVSKCDADQKIKDTEVIRDDKRRK